MIDSLSFPNGDTPQQVAVDSTTHRIYVAASTSSGESTLYVLQDGTNSAAPAITSANNTTITVGTHGTFTVTATGEPTPSLSESGTLPGGVTFTDNGNGTATLAGTPAAGTGGTYTFTITANNGVSPNATQDFTLTISPAAANHLAFATQPSNTTAGVVDPAATVEVLDQYGDLITSDNSDQVTLAVASGPGGFAGGSTTATVNGGIATFSNLLLDTAGSYTLSESATGGLSGANSNSFTVSAAAADHLAFGTQPSNTTAGSAISPAVTVQVLDKYGNLLTADNSDQVTLSISSGPGGFAGDNTVTTTVSDGIATFGNLTFDYGDADHCQGSPILCRKQHDPGDGQPRSRDLR